MIWTYDEWGGWYDHVPPPAAIPPDDIPPELPPGFLPGGFDRYGFRVPAGVISPYARPRLRLAHRLRPHVDPEDGGDQVEPPRPHPSRRQRHRRPRHDRPDVEAGVPETAPPARPGQPGGVVPVSGHGPGTDSASVGGDAGMRRRTVVSVLAAACGLLSGLFRGLAVGHRDHDLSDVECTPADPGAVVHTRRRSRRRSTSPSSAGRPRRSPVPSCSATPPAPPVSCTVCPRSRSWRPTEQLIPTFQAPGPAAVVTAVVTPAAPERYRSPGRLEHHLLVVDVRHPHHVPLGPLPGMGEPGAGGGHGGERRELTQRLLGGHGDRRDHLYRAGGHDHRLIGPRSETAVGHTESSSLAS